MNISQEHYDAIVARLVKIEMANSHQQEQHKDLHNHCKGLESVVRDSVARIEELEQIINEELS